MTRSRAPQAHESVLPAYAYDRLPSMPVALYARLSRNPDGTKESVETQVAAGRRYCEKRWPGRAVIIFTDDNLTAADEDVVRPGYDAMVSAIRRGQVGDVAAKMQARVTRQPGQWDQFRVACLRAGIEDLHTWTKGIVALRSIEGRLMAVIDSDYVETIKLNVNDALDQRARDGRPHGGQPYGYRHQRDESGRSRLIVVKDQAEEVAYMVDCILAGWSLADVCRDLNHRKVPTKKPRKDKEGKTRGWEPTTVKSVVTNATAAGYVVKRGVIAGDGEWDAIIDRDKWERVRSILSQPRTVSRVDGEVRVIKGTKRPARSYLLSGGIVMCGLCDTPMISGLYHKRGQVVPYYWCKKSYGGCGKMAVKAADTEAYAVELFMDWLDSPAFRRYLRTVDADRPKREKLAAKIAAAEARKQEMAAMFGAGAIDTKTLASGMAAADEAIAGHQATLRDLTPVPFETDADAIRDGWDGMGLGEQRQMLFDYGVSVSVAPSSGGCTFDTSRLSVSFPR